MITALIFTGAASVAFSAALGFFFWHDVRVFRLKVDLLAILVEFKLKAESLNAFQEEDVKLCYKVIHCLIETAGNLSLSVINFASPAVVDRDFGTSLRTRGIQPGPLSFGRH
jgi:hypothetical protein